MTLTLRAIEAGDAEAAAQLSTQLGYPVEPGVMADRIRAIALDHHGVIVACADRQVVGWIDVGVVQHLQSGAYAEIGGLVVSEAFRNQGIGTRLLRAAEGWARERGVKHIVVRSQIAREAAHRFYVREGYERTKTSAVFTRTLRQAYAFSTDCT